MSGNQKQGAGGGPQTQRYAGGPYAQFPGADGYGSAPSGPYAPNQGNQGGNQGPGLRAIPSSVPPNQAPTPPNADIKVPTIPQQSAMNQSVFVQQAVRTQPYYQQRTTAPASQTPRMAANHNNRQLYSPATPVFVHQQAGMYAVPQYFPGNRAPQMMPSPIQTVYMPQQPPYSFTSSQPQPPPVPYFNMLIPRTGSLPPQQSAVSNPNPSTMSMPMVQNNPPHPPFQKQPPHKRRQHALQIIDPATGVDMLEELFESAPSGESSARQTPQPPSYNHSKEVQATFSKQVLQAINADIEPTRLEDADQHPHQQLSHQHQDPMMDQAVEQSYPPQPPQLAVPTNIDHLVQPHNFNAMAKEFVLPTTNTAKETPIVSANCDAVEVTIPKLQKDRESPVKRSKPQQQPQLPKEPILKEKEVVEVKPKEVISQPVVTSLTEKKQQPLPTKKVEVKMVEPSKGSGTDYDNVALTLNQQQPPSMQDINSNMKTKQGSQRLATKQNVVVVSTPSPSPAPAAAVVSTPQQSNATVSTTGSLPSKPPVAQVTAPMATIAAATPPAPIPQPQPPKPSNKTHKRHELNQKGANKEGTDMDAFNDNNKLAEVNANEPAPVISDMINANSITTETTTIDAEVDAVTATTPNNNTLPVSNDIVNKKPESNDTTIKTGAVKSLKSKIDVTDIVKDRPKTIVKTYKNEAHDETDRAIPNDQLVQAKNEANAKTNSEIKTTVGGIAESKLPYQDGQWTPTNQTGQKSYKKDFLLALRNAPSSKIKPDNIPDMILADGRGQLSDGRASMGGRTDFTNPPFTNYGGKSGSLRGSMNQKRPSMNKMVAGVKTKSTKLSISVKEDVKLHEVENAWRPTRLNRGENLSDDDKKTAELYKKVRGVLNKLTPQKFETLLSQIKALKIDTPGRLQGVIDLVFDKAVDEPNFSEAYALMCKQLALMQVHTQHSTEENPDYVNFRKLLVTRCQNEFEKQSMDESIRNTKLKEIEACSDAERKKDLQFELDEYDRKLRMKSVGNIRFIGELFKQHMLTVSIMLRCLSNLLDNKDEESLECLCKLLTTIGKELESKNVSLAGIFDQMAKIVDKKDNAGSISSRIKFMLQDVIDLRNMKWVPRRQDLNPKTIDQIQKEADHEQMNIQMMNAGPMTPRRDDRMGPGSMDRKGGRGMRNVDNDGWITAKNNNRTFTVQSDKLKTKAPNMDEPLGSSHMFGLWSKGSVGPNIKPFAQPVPTNTGNIYAALENIDSDKRNIGGRSKEAYSSKGPSLDRSSYKLDGQGSRSGSQHRSNDNSTMSSQRSAPAPANVAPPLVQKAPPLIQQVPPQLQQQQLPQRPAEEMSDQMVRRIENGLEEYVCENCSWEECYLEISSFIPADGYGKLITLSYLWLLEKTQHARVRVGELFAKLVREGRIEVEDYCAGFEDVLKQADDLKIDIPKFWDYLADILVDMICKEALPLSRLQKCLVNQISPTDSVKLLVPLFKLVIEKEGSSFLQSLWHKSGLQLSNFMDSSQEDSFIKDNQFEFLLSDAAPIIASSVPYEEIHMKLKEFFKEKAEKDTIINWIDMHLGKRVEEVKFIRTLATAMFEDCIVNKKVQVERLSQHSNLLLKYVDNNAKFELECLYALQALIHKLEHPQGALLMMVEHLYELGLSSQESFIAWEQSNDPAEQEGKGVALKQLVCFFTQLKENDDDDDESEDET